MSVSRNLYSFSKRIADILLALSALLLLSPLLITVAVMVRLSLGRPVLFRSKRAGLDGKPFVLLKFRSMTDTCDATGSLLPDDQRITGFGRLIRRGSLDELPQLLNVIAGDMSLVGPRPLPLEYNARYDQRQAQRLSVKPGLTGWCQVQYHGNHRTWEEKFEQDLYYVEHQSLRLDVSILIRTVMAVGARIAKNRTGLSTSPTFVHSSTRHEGSPS